MIAFYLGLRKRPYMSYKGYDKMILRIILSPAMIRKVRYQRIRSDKKKHMIPVL